MSKVFVAPSNFALNVESYGREHFEAGMRMAFSDHSTATHFVIDEQTRSLSLLWSNRDESKPLPYAMKADEAIEFVWGWLKTADYGDEPDIDGSCSRNGFRIVSSAGRYTIVRVYAVWSEFHK